MSGAAKKDDHKEEKKSFPAMLVTVTLLIFAVVIFLMISNVSVPMAFNQVSQLVGNIGNELGGMARAFDNFAVGGGDLMRSLLKIAFVLGITALVVSMFLPKKKDDAHAPADAHPPAGGGH